MGVFGLGNTAVESIKLFFLYIYLRFKRLIGQSANFKLPIKLHLKFRQKPFVFYIKYILDFHLLKEIFQDEIYRHEFDSEPEVIVDAGSNIGASVVYFRLLYPDAKIYAIEPHPGCLELLNLNASVHQITVLPAALSAHDEIRKFYFNIEHWSASLFDRNRGGDGVDVQCLSLSTVMSGNNINCIDILKMDIEGAEFEIFENYKEKDKIKLLLGELHPKITGKSFEYFNLLMPEFKLISSRDEGGHVNVIYKVKA